MFEFQPIKSSDVSEECFSKALVCARDSVASILDEDIFEVLVTTQAIEIRPTDIGLNQGMTLSHLKDTVKNCFCDATGALYPEFTRIESSFT